MATNRHTEESLYKPRRGDIFQPRVSTRENKKYIICFGGIFAFFAKIVTKRNKQNINKIQNYKK